MKWLITVGGGYGSFEFDGTKQEAETMRRNKARSEGAPATMRRLTRRALDAALWVCQNCGEASDLSSQRCSVCNTPRQ